MKKNLLFLIFLLVGCGSVVSSNESTTSNGNSSSTSDNTTTSSISLKDSITSSSSDIVSDTSTSEEKIMNVNLINNIYLFKNIIKSDVPLTDLGDIKIRDLNPLVNGIRLKDMI